MAKVTIVATETIKPIGDIAGEAGYGLTAWDRRHFGSKYVVTVHLYKPPVAAGMVGTLRESLGRALAHFYPLAGRFRLAQGRVEVDCNAKGVVLVEADCVEDLAYFEADAATDKMRVLAPVVDDVKSTPLDDLPLLYVQITRLRCGGAALAVALSHVVADGLTAFHFFSEWARLARGEALKEAPFLDKKVLLSAYEGRRQQVTFSDDHKLAPPPLTLGKPSMKTRTLSLLLTDAQIHKLKAEAEESRVISDADSRPYTRYEVVAAHTWRCLCKARGHKEDQRTALYVSFNIRNRTPNVPLPSRYFGNAVFTILLTITAGEVMSSPLWFVCNKIRETISKVDEDYIWSNMKSLDGETVNSSATESLLSLWNPNLRVTSWLTLPIYNMDFGWGNPVATRPVFSDLDGTSYMLPNNDGSSIQLVLCLQVDHANLFNKYFYQNISIN